MSEALSVRSERQKLQYWLHKIITGMGSIRVISTSNIQSATQNGDSSRKMELTPWDLQLLLVDPIQKGLLFHNPKPNRHSIIQHLKSSLSLTLHFFPPLAGRLAIVEHADGTTTAAASVSILCNNSGALFVHAVAHNLTVADIVEPTYTPRIVHSFFPLNGVRNYEGTCKPLLGVQVTELVDGIFIGCTINHTVADGTSFWHFFNSWSEISRRCRGTNTTELSLSRPPDLERWFLDDTDRPIRIPKNHDEISTHKDKNVNISALKNQERVFHFSKQKIAELKAKGNALAGSTKISSLQALVTHIWQSIVRNQGMEAEEEVKYRLLIGNRPRIGGLSENYFGNAVQDGSVSMKAGELVVAEGLGKGALEMNKMVGLHTEEKVVGEYKSWVKRPRLLTESGMAGNALVTSSSPRFNVYGNDFGWGKPVAVRSGAGNKTHGKITVFAGADEGSIDVEVCLSYEILEAMGNDSHFMDAYGAMGKYHT
ncbi:putative acetyltransferase [Senna tora]|uniref:Putative acetyltransferase n=1 Tax=Senna tora TaxID=362788 RepID=A0A834WPL6_9FABA|nr:putative acetyltransferase [Senna tora]